MKSPVSLTIVTARSIKMTFLDRDPISQKKKENFALRDLYDNGNTGEMLHS